MGIGKNIKRLRKLRGLSQEELAKELGVSRAAVTQWETGWSSPRMGMIEKLSSFFDVSKAELIDGPVDPLPSGARPIRGTSAMVPLRALGVTHAGERMDEDEAAYDVEFPASVAARHPNAFALRVEGDCMDRRYPEGCHIMVDPDVEPSNGSAVVAEFEDGRSVLRNYLRGTSTLMLTADSHADHDDIVVTADDAPVRTLGVVVWFQADSETE